MNWSYCGAVTRILHLDAEKAMPCTAEDCQNDDERLVCLCRLAAALLSQPQQPHAAAAPVVAASVQALRRRR